MSRNIILIQGTVAAIDVYQNDLTADTVTIYMKDDETDNLIINTATYENGVATVMLEGDDTAIVGVYSYQINENLPDGIAKYGTFECEDCEWGKIIICEALDGGIS